MSGDEACRRCVAALWALVEAARGGSGEQRQAAAAHALAALCAVRGEQGFTIVHEAAGAIHVDGRLVSLGVDVFTAANGLVRLMQARGIGEILFERGVDVAALLAWADAFAADARSEAAAIQVGRRGPQSEPPLQLGRQRATPEAGDSRLRAVFLENQLMAAVEDAPVPPTESRGIVHEVVEHLLATAGGLEPLTLLHKSPGHLRLSLQVAVIAAKMARVCGWPESRLGELAGVALLHDVGALVDPTLPASAGFHWLIERGTSDFWLRCAVVGSAWRRARDPRMTGALGDAELLTVTLVRLARGIAESWCHLAPGDLRAALDRLGRLGRFGSDEVAIAEIATAAPA